MTARGAVKALKDLVPLARLDADSTIAHTDDRTVVLARDGYVDGAGRGGELDRVPDQIRYRFTHQIAVAENLHRSLHLQGHLDRLRRGERLVEFEQLCTE